MDNICSIEKEKQNVHETIEWFSAPRVRCHFEAYHFSVVDILIISFAVFIVRALRNLYLFNTRKPEGALSDLSYISIEF